MDPFMKLRTQWWLMTAPYKGFFITRVKLLINPSILKNKMIKSVDTKD